MWIALSEYLRYTVETALGMRITSVGLAKKPRFGVNTACIAVGAALLCILLAALPDVPSALVYLLLTVAAMAFVTVPYAGNWKNKLFSCMTGVMLRMLGKKLHHILVALLASPLLEKGQPLRYVVYYGLLLLVYLGAATLFAKVNRSFKTVRFHGAMVGAYAAALLLNLLLGTLEPVLLPLGTRYYALLLVCEAVYYLLLLAVQLILIRSVRAEVDAELTQKLWAQDKRQYEQRRETIEAINIKCHDLRHHIREIQNGASEQYAADVAALVSIYDAGVQTGSETLDVILSDKRLLCETKDIPFTVMADGARLAFMEPSDLYALFGNLIDNAIEAEMRIEEPAERFISLIVREKAGCTEICVENACTAAPDLSDGLPATSKADKTLHGYGLLSVRRIAQNYGGSLRLSHDDGVFTASVLFPPQ